MMRSPVTTVTYSGKVGSESLRVKARIYKTNKLKCNRCGFFQKFVSEGICADCRRVMNQVLKIEYKPQQKLLE